MHGVNGVHHITAIAGPAQENLDFYAGVLGMRLVKRSVNQDDPTTYHLFYADAEGHPGFDLTFFPWAQIKSVYFREPGGVLFELATDGPGFAVDEDPAHLGETLVLPPWLEAHRTSIEQAQPPLAFKEEGR
jgi:catechol 2,3-dioxygenase-like lactoylglutathione lyase family enzyme